MFPKSTIERSFQVGIDLKASQRKRQQDALSFRKKKRNRNLNAKRSKKSNIQISHTDCITMKLFNVKIQNVNVKFLKHYFIILRNSKSSILNKARSILALRLLLSDPIQKPPIKAIIKSGIMLHILNLMKRAIPPVHKPPSDKQMLARKKMKFLHLECTC